VEYNYVIYIVYYDSELRCRIGYRDGGIIYIFRGKWGCWIWYIGYTTI